MAVYLQQYCISGCDQPLALHRAIAVLISTPHTHQWYTIDLGKIIFSSCKSPAEVLKAMSGGVCVVLVVGFFCLFCGVFFVCVCFLVFFF